MNFAGRADTFRTPPRFPSPLRRELDDTPQEVVQEIALVVQAELAENAAAAALCAGIGLVAADAAPPRVPAPDALDVEDDSSVEEANAPLAKLPRPDGMSRSSPTWSGWA